MRSILTVSSASLLLFAATSLAQDRPQDRSETDSEAEADLSARADEDAEEEAQEADPGEEVICRRDRATGSLTRVNRVCMTRNEWNGISSKSQQAHANSVRGASGNQCFGC